MVCKIIKVFYTDHIFLQLYRKNKCCPQWMGWEREGGGEVWGGGVGQCTCCVIERI